MRVITGVVAVLALLAACADNPTGSSGGRGGTGGTGSAPPGMAYLTGGSFIMGDDEHNNNEQPAHQAYVQPFALDETEVTQADYDELMSTAYASYSSPFWSVTYGLGDNYPAYYINWYDAILYCNARSLRDGLDTVYSYTYSYGTRGNDVTLTNVSADLAKNGYRLPTEAEWEYACRAGSALDYAWGTSTDTATAYRYAWFGSAGAYGMKPVGGKLPNAFGLYDMHGNAEEWVHDWYDYDYDGAASVDSGGPGYGSYKVQRGGYWGASSYYVRSSVRAYDQPYDEDQYIGFRCAQRGSFVPLPEVTVAQPPVAAAGDTVVLTAAVAGDSSGAFSEFHWSFDGAGYYDSTMAGTFRKVYADTGTYAVRVKAQDATGRFTRAAVMYVYVRGTAPQPVSPADQETVDPASAVLSWRAGAYADHFRVLFGSVNPPVTQIASTVTDTQYDVSSLVTRNSYYFWRVVGVSADGREDTSAVRGFLSPFDPVVQKQVAGGTFSMGATVLSNEQPVHAVTLTAFRMDSTEVTRREYEGLMGYDPAGTAGSKDEPVTGVTWFDAVLYCNARSARESRTAVYTYTSAVMSGSTCTNLYNLSVNITADGFRLPTEAEWEYACRGGNTGAYSFGNDEALLGGYAWYSGNAGGTVHAVASRSANVYGLYDMHGNVWEWCHDWYGAYGAAAAADPTGPSTGFQRVARGGAYTYAAAYLRSAIRANYEPDTKSNAYGFRCVRR